MIDPFSIGRSRDEGATFETLLRFDTLCGTTGCGPDSTSYAACGMDWTGNVGASLGSTCGLDAGAPEAEPDGDGGPDASEPVDASADEPTNVARATDYDAGGGCALVLGTSKGGRAGFLVLLGLLIGRRRTRPSLFAKLV
jgi:hypothetical protein